MSNEYFRKTNLLQRKLNYWQIASKLKKMQKRSDLLESFLDKYTLCHSCDIFNTMWHPCQLWQIWHGDSRLTWLNCLKLITCVTTQYKTVYFKEKMSRRSSVVSAMGLPSGDSARRGSVSSRRGSVMVVGGTGANLGEEEVDREEIIRTLLSKEEQRKLER